MTSSGERENAGEFAALKFWLYTGDTMATVADGELVVAGDGRVEVAGGSSKLSRYSRGGASTNVSISSSGSALGVGGDGRAGGKKYDLE